MARFEKVEIGNATLYCGDCRAVMLRMGPVHSVITDPVWPIAAKDSVPGSGDPWGLWRSAVRTMPEFLRLIAVLRLGSDPRFLSEIYPSVSFVGAIPLAYEALDGEGPAMGLAGFAFWYGARVCGSAEQDRLLRQKPYAPWRRSSERSHPLAWPVEHFEWLVHGGSDAGETVLDPFMGSGTTGVACAKLGRPFVGIEVHRPYFEIACKRIEEAQRQGDWVSDQGAA